MCLFLGRKAMTNLDNILKVHLVKAMVFLVVMNGCESWTIRKAECQRTDAFELWCQRRRLRISWTARNSNHSILNEISPEYSLEGLMLMLQYSGHLMWRTDFSNKTQMLGKTEGRRKRGWQRWQMIRWHHRLDGHESEQIPGDGDRQGIPVCCSPRGRKESDTTEQLK